MGITETAATTTTTTGMGAANAVEGKQILSLEAFQDIFKHVEPEVQIDAFEVSTSVGALNLRLTFSCDIIRPILLFQLTQGSDRGDNYTAALYRIKLTGKRRDLKWEQNVICKVMPESLVAREAYKSDKLFR